MVKQTFGDENGRFIFQIVEVILKGWLDSGRVIVHQMIILCINHPKMVSLPKTVGTFDSSYLQVYPSSQQSKVLVVLAGFTNKLFRDSVTNRLNESTLSAHIEWVNQRRLLPLCHHLLICY